MSNKDQSEYIREAVHKALSEKEEAERRTQVENLLKDSQSTIEGLKGALTEKEEELAVAEEAKTELNNKNEELASKVSSLEEDLASVKANLDEVEKRAQKAEKELASIEAAARLKDRMSELEEAKVASASEEARTLQESRVKGMNEEEFAAYKSELVELRSELEKSFKEAVDTAKAADEQKKKEEEEAKAKAEADDAKKKREEAAAAAAGVLNVETASESVTQKYARFGAQLAKQLEKNSQ